ncbi:MAG TPA: type I-U CRISPR-associated protein Csx17, partial [Gammaproteobacteria bacterium]|nr:type I-U CRISPR-associated protein Csx17 [Gammaproteobacteria bacterium]
AILNELSLVESPKERDKKNHLLNLLRAELPDSGLSSLDASILISSDNLMFPPLLGTGGTDGNLDFTNNFIQRLFDLVENEDGKPTPAASDLLINTLFDDITVGWKNDAIGQFSPGQAGGPNAGTGYEAGALINPWNFVLMIEGSLLFAAAATRRLGVDGAGAMAFPFTVRPKGSGQGGVALSDESSSRAEIWLPLWSSPASLGSIKSLFSEGRVALGRHSARDGLDFSRAVSTLAASRGINSFQRYTFMKRSGKAFLAMPLNRFYIPRKPQQDLISELDHWLWRFQSWARRDEAANHIKMLAHRLDDALFDLSRHGTHGCGAVQKVLITLGQIQQYAGTSASTRENIPPVPFLSERWFFAARDNSLEFHIASALAGLGSGNKHTIPMWAHLSPLDPGRYFPDWLPEGAKHHYYTWNHGGIEKNLVAVLEKRLLLAHKPGQGDKPLGGRLAVDVAVVGAFLDEAIDDNRIGQLLPGLAHCKIPAKSEQPPGEEPFPVPAAYALIKLLFVPDRQLQRCGLLAGMAALPIPPGLMRLLATGRTQDALALAQRRLRIAGLSTLGGTPSAAGISGRRLAASLLIPLTDAAVRKLHHLICRRSAEQRQAS